MKFENCGRDLNCQSLVGFNHLVLFIEESQRTSQTLFVDQIQF
jgi:hypothetical protein